MVDDIETTLAEHEFFAGMKAQDLKFLASCAKHRQLRGNQVLFGYGAPADEFFVLLTGGVTLEVAAIEGPALVLQTLGPGAVLGWSWLIPPYRWSFQARADAETEVLEFNGKVILARCESDPEFGYDVLKRFSSLMSERLSYARSRMMEAWNPPGFA